MYKEEKEIRSRHIVIYREEDNKECRLLESWFNIMSEFIVEYRGLESKVIALRAHNRKFYRLPILEVITKYQDNSVEREFITSGAREIATYLNKNF